MAKKCLICDKHVVTGNNVSHAKNRTKKRIQPNLKRVKMIVNGRVVRDWACTRCIRSGKVKKAA